MSASSTPPGNDSTEIVLDVPEAPEAAARARVYALFAEAFSYPAGATVLRLLDGDLLADLGDAIAQSPVRLDVLPNLPTPTNKSAVQELQVSFTALFDVTGGTPAVSLLERRYGSEPEQKLWQELLSYYRHFGLDFSAGYANEQPDHLLTQLSFMHYLAFLEAGAPGDRSALLRGQRDFLLRHLHAWVQEMAEKLSATEHGEPYASIGQLLARFVGADLKYLHEQTDDVENNSAAES